MNLEDLASRLTGRLHTGRLMRRLYATDASAYQEMPLAVAIPETENDIRELILFAGKHGVGIIPRAAGTSLAGQVVGNGIVVDVSEHFTRVLGINPAEGWARVQPGVIRNELNQDLRPHGFFFAPETSTQNRAMIGGMMGNNSCGANSVKYGSVRDHLIEVRGFLADGSEATFGPLTVDEFRARCEGPDSLETRLYRHVREKLVDPETRREIDREFPRKSIPRRNTGYALDLLMDAAVFDPAGDKPFNFCKLIAGSEGTLFFATEIKLHIEPLPPGDSGLLIAHFDSIADSLAAALVALREEVYACEIIDHFILECTRRSIEHRENRFFLEGNPKAILVVEIRGESESDVRETAARIERAMRAEGIGYAFPLLWGEDCQRVWNLRNAGLGLLTNMPGDTKPVAVIEDTAVAVADLPAYIAEFDRRLEERFGLACVHYAHAGSGEIHLRPIINLKTEEGVRLFREVARCVADLVKEYRGSLSGEHGDGRLRGEFLRQMVGEGNYRLIEDFKKTWDPKNIFNPGKIVDTPPMNSSLRYAPGRQAREVETWFDFSASGGILRAAEMCNGSGDCRKTERTGGTMCPSYMATRWESATTRARANTLRQILTESVAANPFDSEELHEVMDLCLSCKGCKSECPSTVDLARLKTEFLQHYHDANGISLRSRMVGSYAAIQRIASWAPWGWNGLFGCAPIRRVLNRAVGFHPERTIPKVAKQRFSRWFRNRPRPGPDRGEPVGKVFLFGDEFTEYNDVEIGVALVELLEALGYRAEIPDHLESGRSSFSKGLLRRAKKFARGNVERLRGVVTAESPLIGIEPSAILGFRDEVPDLVGEDLAEAARELGRHCFLFEEWFVREIDAGRIRPESFTDARREILVHGHCHQKALSSAGWTVRALSLPKNYRATQIPSGCCGMAGAFGYEREHYELSQKVGELVLFPAVRAAPGETIIAAPGTSCRHQISDGTGRRALHPAEILRAALA